MAKINMHGMKMVGLKKVSGETDAFGHYSPGYYEIFYNRSTGEIWAVYQHSLGHNAWTEYHDADVIPVCQTSEHMTMQDIADMIYHRCKDIDEDALLMREAYEAGKAAEEKYMRQMYCGC